MRSTGYQNVTTKLIAMVAIFSVIVALSVVVVYRANESIHHDDKEYLWFKIDRIYNGNLDITGDVFIYDEVGVPLEHILLLNTTDWQSSQIQYVSGGYVRIYLSFWYLVDEMNNVAYKVSRGFFVALDNVTVTIFSDVEEP